jgi:hypothetical protein
LKIKSIAAHYFLKYFLQLIDVEKRHVDSIKFQKHNVFLLEDGVGGASSPMGSMTAACLAVGDG